MFFFFYFKLLQLLLKREWKNEIFGLKSVSGKFLQGIYT